MKSHSKKSRHQQAKIQSHFLASSQQPDQQDNISRKPLAKLTSPPAKRKQESILVSEEQKEQWRKDEHKGRFLDSDDEKEVDKCPGHRK